MALFLSVVGLERQQVGFPLNSGPRMIVAFGTRREHYHRACEVQCYSGIAPVIGLFVQIEPRRRA